MGEGASKTGEGARAATDWGEGAPWRPPSSAEGVVLTVAAVVLTVGPAVGVVAVDGGCTTGLFLRWMVTISRLSSRANAVWVRRGSGWVGLVGWLVGWLE